MMNRIKSTLASLLLIVSLLFSFASCDLAFISQDDNTGTQDGIPEFYITGDATRTLKVGDTLTLELVVPEDAEGTPVWTSSHSCATVEGGVITAVSEGTAVIKVVLGDYVDRVTVQVIGDGISDGGNEDDDDDNTDDGNNNDNNSDNNNSDNNNSDNDDENDDVNNDNNNPEDTYGSEYDVITVAEALLAAESYTSSASKDVYYVVVYIDIIASAKNGEMFVYDDTGDIYVYRSGMIDGSSLSECDIDEGDRAIICGTLRNYKGLLEFERATIIDYYTPGEEVPTPPDQGGDDDNEGNGGNNGDVGGTVIWPTPGDPITEDPYVNVDVDAFYADYRPAISYMDAYYRTLHNLMSGEIADQDQAPTVSAYQPTEDGKYVRNTSYIYSEDGNTYFVVDAYGEIVFEVYRGAAYVMLEEVAAYVFAFGEPPANHSASKNTSPLYSPWGIYLRVNHTVFSGDTYRFPYEPELPNISGCGGDLTYYEMDIGTTGTTCDPSYTAALYNNGTSITRGAARIVYTRSDYDRDGVVEPDETYLFYTYNHYNDFQEYLNYQGGWGQIFGNITGGGTISSKSDYNPTPYVNVVLAPFVTSEGTTQEIIVFILPKREEM